MLFCIFLKEKPETPVLQNRKYFIWQQNKWLIYRNKMLFGGILQTSFYSEHTCDLVLGIWIYGLKNGPKTRDQSGAKAKAFSSFIF